MGRRSPEIGDRAAETVDGPIEPASIIRSDRLVDFGELSRHVLEKNAD